MPVKPSEREGDSFTRKEFEEKLRAEMEVEEKKKEHEHHFMNCPQCGMKLIEINYKGIVVDKCSSCDGIWLDAGELDAVSKMDEGTLFEWFTAFKK